MLTRKRKYSGKFAIEKENITLTEYSIYIYIYRIYRCVYKTSVCNMTLWPCWACAKIRNIRYGAGNLWRKIWENLQCRVTIQSKRTFAYRHDCHCMHITHEQQNQQQQQQQQHQQQCVHVMWGSPWIAYKNIFSTMTCFSFSPLFSDLPFAIVIVCVCFFLLSNVYGRIATCCQPAYCMSSCVLNIYIIFFPNFPPFHFPFLFHCS